MTASRSRARRALWVVVRPILRALFYGVLGGTVVAISVLVYLLESRPDLDVWHSADLDAEFTRDSKVETFEEYLSLEERLFAQLDELVYDAPRSASASVVDRYSKGSLADPGRWPRNWNRSFELASAAPTAAVLMLHGMSDAPYSMRSLAERMHAQGAHVVGMRVPGHGTAPVGLVHVEWEDMAAAVELSVKSLRRRAPEVPLLLFGYSNGGALSVLYALSALEDASLPSVDGIVLLSPEIGITKLAALAAWQERLGHLLGLEKLQWQSLIPEYDPFQYKSFALNAGKQAHLITLEIQSRIDRLVAAGSFDYFPPTLAFQSVVDGTVTAAALVEGLLTRLPPGNHELVLFDLNRIGPIESVLKADPTAWIGRVLHDPTHPFGVTAIVNVSEESVRVEARRKSAGASDFAVETLDDRWPVSVYSLSHIALPFPPDDPLYGGPEASPSPGVALGDLALRGERGTLRVSPGDLLRMHWNPFHDYMMDRIVAFTKELPLAPRSD